MQAAQDVDVGGRPTRTQFQYTLQDANLDELNDWAPKILDKLQDAAGAARRRHRPADRRHDADSSTIDRDTASRYGIHAAADRRHALRRLRPAPGRAVFHPAQQLPRDHGGAARAAGRARHARQDLRQVADDRRAGAAVGVRQLDHACRSQPLSISHQGQFPAVTISFNLAPGRGARPGDRGRCRQADGRAAACRATLTRQLPGQRAGVPGLARHGAAADPGGARRGLPDPRHSLRELHPSADDPVDAAVGRRRRARDR